MITLAALFFEKGRQSEPKPQEWLETGLGLKPAAEFVLRWTEKTGAALVYYWDEWVCGVWLPRVAATASVRLAQVFADRVEQWAVDLRSGVAKQWGTLETFFGWVQNGNEQRYVLLALVGMIALLLRVLFRTG